MKLGEFLRELNSQASLQSLKLVMVRSFEELPNVRTGNDIDFIVNSDELQDWTALLSNVCSNNGLQFKIYKTFDYCTKTLISGIDGEENGLEIDLNNSFFWRGVEFYPTRKFIEDSRLANEIIYSNSNALNMYITFCHSYLYGGFVMDKYLDKYLEVVSDKAMELEFQGYLSDVFGLGCAEQIIKLLQVRNKVELERISTKIRISVILRAFLRSPFTMVINLFKSLLKS